MNRIVFLILTVGLPLMVGQMCGPVDPAWQQPDSPSPNDDTDDHGSNTPPPTHKQVVGPGFSLTVPAQFAAYSGAIAPARANHVDAYHDGQRLLLIWTETPVADGFYCFSSAGTCIEQSVASDSGDFVLQAVTGDVFSGAEDLGGYALLANGDLLCTKLCTGRPLTDDDRTLATALFRSINLDDTDGCRLESCMRGSEKRILGYTSEGIIVLADLSVWRLALDAGDDADAELRSWAAGDAVHLQHLGEYHEMLTIGRWHAIPVRDLGLAIKTTIAEYDKSTRQLVLGTGQTRVLPLPKLPAFWAVGDEVLIVRDEGRDWLVRIRTFHSIRL